MLRRESKRVFDSPKKQSKFPEVNRQGKASFEAKRNNTSHLSEKAGPPGLGMLQALYDSKAHKVLSC